VKFGISPSLKFFDQFSHLSFEICEFSHFNQILLSLFDISSTYIMIVFELFTPFDICSFQC